MTPNLLISIGLFSVLCIGALVAFYGWLQIRSFLSQYSSISCQQGVDEFKRVVKTDMYLAVSMMIIAIAAVGVVVTGMALGLIGWADLRLVLYIMGPICACAGAILTKSEERMKSLPVDEDSLRKEVEIVVHRWTSSTFPDW